MANQEFLVVRENVVRVPGKESFTPGKFYCNGVKFCVSCEDEDRHLENGMEKIYGRTAIPRGRYRVIVTMSKRFGKRLPLLVGTEPLFSGVRIHGANRAEDLLGCIGIGQVNTKDGIAQCADTVQRLIRLIDMATKQSVETWLEIK